MHSIGKYQNTMNKLNVVGVLVNFSTVSLRKGLNSGIRGAQHDLPSFCIVIWGGR